MFCCVGISPKCFLILVRTNSRFCANKLPVGAILLFLNSFWKSLSKSFSKHSQLLEYLSFQCRRYHEKMECRNSWQGFKLSSSFWFFEKPSLLLSIKQIFFEDASIASNSPNYAPSPLPKLGRQKTKQSEGRVLSWDSANISAFLCLNAHKVKASSP